jgi:hypothetical protein
VSKWNITDQQSGDTLTIEADRAPTQADADEIFKSRKTPTTTASTDLSQVKLNPLEKAQMAGIPGPNASFEQYASTHDPSQAKPPEPGVLDEAWNTINYNPVEEGKQKFNDKIKEGALGLQAYRQSTGEIRPDYTDPVTQGQFGIADINRSIGVTPSKRGGWSDRDVQDAMAHLDAYGKPTGVAGNVAEGVVDVATSFLTPIGIATLGIGGLPKAAQKALSLAFAAQMASQTPDIAKELGQEMGKPEGERDTGKIAGLLTKFAGTSAFAGLAAAHGLSPRPEPTIPEGVQNAQAIRSNAGQVQVPRDVQQGGEVQGRTDIQQPTPRTPSNEQAPRTATSQQILLSEPHKPKREQPFKVVSVDTGNKDARGNRVMEFHVVDDKGNTIDRYEDFNLSQAKARAGRLNAGIDTLMDAVEQNHLEREAEGMGTGVEMTESPGDNEPFAGQIATINRKTGKILIRPTAYNRWIQSVPEGRREMARKSLLWEERLHLSNSDADATGYLDKLSALERRIAQRRYRGPHDTTPMSAIELGHEALRYRQQQLMNMTPREVAEAALRERWTLKGLDAVDSVVRNMREVFGHEGGDSIARAVINRMQQNITAARSAIGAEPSATSKEQERPRFDYSKLSEDERREYSKLHSDAMAARQAHDKLDNNETADKLIDSELALSKFENKRGPSTFRVTVQHPQVPGDKGYVQVDEFNANGENVRSTNPETLQKEGMNIPSTQELMKFKQGQYPLEDVAGKGFEPSARIKKGKKVDLGDLDQPGFWPVMTSKGIPGAEDVGTGQRISAEGAGAMPSLSASALEGHAANWMQPIVSSGKVPEFKDFVEYMKGKQPELKPGQLNELWQKSVFDYLTKAPGDELSKLMDNLHEKENIMGLKVFQKVAGGRKRVVKGKVIADPPTPEELTHPERTVRQAGEINRSAQQRREMAISDIAYSLVNPELGKADLGRKTISPDELRYGGGKDIGAVQDFRPVDERNPDLLGRQLVDESRRSSRDPVSVTKRVTAIMDRRTGKVNLVSTFYDGRRGAVLYDPGALQHTPIKDILPRYRVLSSYLLDEPVKDFRQSFDSLKDFNAKFGADARSQYAAETSYVAPPVHEFEEGVEGTPGIQQEGGDFAGGPGKAQAAIEQGVARGAVEQSRKTGMTPVEASAMLDHVMSEQATFDSPDDAVEAMLALPELPSGKTAAAVSGFAKLARAVQRDHPDASIQEIVNLTARQLYENHTQSTSFEDFVARTTGKRSAPAPEAVPPKEPGTDISTIRTKAPTYDPNVVTGQGPAPEAKMPPPIGPEMLSPKQQRQLERRLREDYEPSATQKPVRDKSYEVRIANVTIALKDFLAKSKMTAAATGQLSDRLHQLTTMAKADYIQASPIVKAAADSLSHEDAVALSKFADDMQVLGKSGVKLTDFQKEVLQSTVLPLMDANKSMFTQLRNMQINPGESTYFARIAKDTHSLFENIRRGVRHGVVEGGILGKGASFLKRRSMKVLVDEAGGRQVVSIKYGSESNPGRITAWTDKEPRDMGKFVHSDMQKSEQRMTSELEPVWKKSQELRNQIGYLQSLKLDPAAQVAADKRIMRLRVRLADSLTQEDFIRAQYDPKTMDQKYWKDSNGKRWRVTDGTISEIEKHSDVKYYHDPITTLMSQFLKLRQIHRAAKFLEDFKSSPEFRKIAAPVDDRNTPEDWVQTQLPQLKGFRFEPRVAAELDKFHRERQGSGVGLEALMGINTLLRDSVFTVTPFIHDPNLLANFFFARGLIGGWVNPKGWMSLARTGTKAFVDVATKSPDYLKALRTGAPLLHFRMSDMLNDYQKLLQKEFMDNPGFATRISQSLGYLNPLKLLGSLGFHTSWGLNDTLTLQLIYEAQSRYGMSMDEAIHEVGKHFVDYRMPARLPDWAPLSNKYATALPKLLSNPNVMMFGRYHYGVLRNVGEQFKNLASKAPAIEKARSLDRIAAGVFLMAAAYPMVDAIMRKIGNDKKLKIRRAGVTTIPYNLMRMMRGEETPPEFIQSVFTPAIATKALVEDAVNRDFRTGARIYDPQQGPVKAIKALGGHIAESVAPVKMAEDIAAGGNRAKAVGLSMIGVTRSGQDDLQQVQSLAANWREKAGIEEPEILLPAGEASYQRLRHALANDDRGAGAIYKELLKDHTQRQVDAAMKAWSRRPFTGSRKHEKEFIDSLDHEQRKLYWRAMDQRDALLRKYYGWSNSQ